MEAKKDLGSFQSQEFWNFVEKFSPGMLSRQASDELHEFIDADRSGGIEPWHAMALNVVGPGRTSGFQWFSL